jgi:NADH-quinone oxidoreductase subunit D
MEEQQSKGKGLSAADEQELREFLPTRERNAQVQYVYDPSNLAKSEPTKYNVEELPDGQMLLNIGPQHPSTHGVLRLEVITDGEFVVDVVPHMGYLHRCFEKHAESLSYPQVIPYVDRMDYLASMNSEHAYVMGVEKMLGITDQIPK